MSAAVRYTLARVGIFVACILLALVALPGSVDLLLKILIALAVSAGLSFFLLRPLRDQVAEGLLASSRERMQAKERLRAALNGEDEEEHEQQPDR